MAATASPQAAKDAVLNANYVKARLEDTSSRRRSATSPACTRRCSTTASSKGTGVTTLDFAKALIDEGFHPMTMYFPLVVHGAMLIEPTEMREQADARCASATSCSNWPTTPRPANRRASPRRRLTAPRRRLDETRAARVAAAGLCAARGRAPGGGVGWRSPLDTFERQAQASARIGSPFTAALCRAIPEALGKTALCLASATGPAIRTRRRLPSGLCGGLHALVLAGVAPDLLAAYPPNQVEAAALRAALADAIVDARRVPHRLSRQLRRRPTRPGDPR